MKFSFISYQIKFNLIQNSFKYKNNQFVYLSKINGFEVKAEIHY